jgi:hypothetical protein
VTRRERRERAEHLARAQQLVSGLEASREARLERRMARINALHNGRGSEYRSLERGREMMLEGLRRLGVL